MKKKTLLAIIVVIFMGTCVFQIFKLSKTNIEYTNKLARFEKIITQRQQYRDNLDIIKTMIQNKTPGPSTTDRIRLVLEFVHDNSLHSIDDENRAYAYRRDIVVKKLILASRGHKEEKPHLSCGPRANIMTDILASFGVTSRIIQIYSDAYAIVKSHRLLEVFNQESQTWELWDPDYRVTYVNSVTKKPENIINIVFGDIEKIVPKDNRSEGWKETNTEELKTHNFFGAVFFEPFRAADSYGIILINQKKFDVNKTFEGGITFKDWVMQNYHYPRFVHFPFSN
jgi:hypothetical protein